MREHDIGSYHEKSPLWWQRGVIYQIYPRSFSDSNADGIGDLAGITSKLDYLAWLGIDAVWLSPIYPSPMVDFGYDITDYTNVHPLFGTLRDFDALLKEAHRRGIKVILDYVPNHTSDQHLWFQEARSSLDNPRRDWYIWRDPAPNGGPPNNWLGVFGGAAWIFDAMTGQYYYHAYLPEQPDLNWRNPQVREAMLGVLRFWLDKGVDGFRVDALRHLIKDREFRDNPVNHGSEPRRGSFDTLSPVYTTDRPEVHEVLTEMRRVLDTYGAGGEARLMIGELYLPIERLVRYYGESNSGVHLPANFHLILTPWDARKIAQLIDEYEAALPPDAWPNWVLGNHDRSRIASRLGDMQARIAALLLLTLRGTPTLYYGDELGMRDGDIPPGMVQDPLEKNFPGQGLGRDPVRTPMQWNLTANADFCPPGVTPWLPVSKDYAKVNVAVEKKNPSSMLSLYRALIALRRAEPAFSIGNYTPIEADGCLLAYRREWQDRRFLVALNMGNEVQVLESPKLQGRVVLATGLDRHGEEVVDALSLRGHEGAIVEL
jgi:alpha-glucosidase